VLCTGFELFKRGALANKTLRLHELQITQHPFRFESQLRGLK
jgi:hypothetical protein